MSLLLPTPRMCHNKVFFYRAVLSFRGWPHESFLPSITTSFSLRSQWPPSSILFPKNQAWRWNIRMILFLLSFQNPKLVVQAQAPPVSSHIPPRHRMKYRHFLLLQNFRPVMEELNHPSAKEVTGVPIPKNCLRKSSQGKRPVKLHAPGRRPPRQF